DAVLVHVVPRSLAVRPRIERAVAHRELDAVGEQSLMEMERLLGNVPERCLVSLPAERTDREIRVDAFDLAGVEAPVRSGRHLAERDALGGERLLDRVAFRLRPLARG